VNALEILRQGHRFLLASLEDFPQEQCYSPRAVGYWSVKDVVAHVGSFELALVEVLENLEEYQEAHTRLMAPASHLGPDAWQQEAFLPWYGMEYDLEDFAVYTYYGHKREHGGQIQVFGDRFK
jgi:hypothetical protein